MKVSIIIPTRNRPVALRQCLASLHDQIAGIVDAEIIIVDDCSTTTAYGDVQSLCTRYKVTLLQTSHTGGAAAARNVGIKHSTGNWIAFIDDDVIVDTGWYSALCKRIDRSDREQIAGIEGCVVASGKGLWDNEVQNRCGGLFLTCNCAYKKPVLETTGGFDEYFFSRCPSCEDQELALRIKQFGTIVFEPAMIVTHQPRSMKLLTYCIQSMARMTDQLNAEYYLYHKHPAAYHTIRHAPTFYGTYKTILLKNFIITFKRRSFSQCLNHPISSMFLFISSLIEQLAAAKFLSSMLFTKKRPRFFTPFVDNQKTAQAWKIDPSLCPGIFEICGRTKMTSLVPLTMTRHYDACQVQKRISAISHHNSLKLLIRIDDLFFDMPDMINHVCSLLAKHSIPFLAAVTANDMKRPDAGTFLKRITESGGVIGLHGFTHSGHYGPFPSEVMQMTRAELQSTIEKFQQSTICTKYQPCAFIPPFNAITREQIMLLSVYFPIICTGPETARHTDHLFGPLVLTNGNWLVPSFYPWYSTAKSMLSNHLPLKSQSLRGHVCLTLHAPWEADDGFSNMPKLLSEIASNCTGWHTLVHQSEGVV